MFWTNCGVKLKKSFLGKFIFFSLSLIFFAACATTKNNLPEQIQEPQSEQEIVEPTFQTENLKSENEKTEIGSIKLLFAGDIMAHEENLRLLDYNKIWKDVDEYIHSFDLAFANIEAPMDETKEPSTYPNFNMPKAYAQAAINAGFSVFSLSNNHTNDQGASGIKETIAASKALTLENAENGTSLYFAGLKESAEADFTYHLIEKNGWKILFLPITELLNRPNASDYVNFVRPDEKDRKKFIEYCKALREENPCDLFVLSIHTSEPEYKRSVTKKQENFYMELLDCGVDILWANHAHIIKDRKFVFDSKTGRQKIIMFANGNTISGQRRAPELDSKNPKSERDNTGDGLLYQVTFTKNAEGLPQISFAKPFYITTYINTANEFLLKPLDTDFINYLYDIPRKSWAEYITRRKKITEESTKDYIIWQ